MKSKDTMFSPIKKQRAFEEISLSIKELIIRGDLKPGDRLPSETQLSKQFNVGRQTTREALRLLETTGFISIQKGGKGSPVVEDSVNTAIRNLFIDLFRLRNISIKDLTVARQEIERIILNCAIEMIDDSDIQKLKANLKAAKQKITNQEMATKENIEFHRLLAKSTKNVIYVIVMECIMAIHVDFLSREKINMEISSNVVDDHEKILEAIITKDADLANRISLQHLDNVRERLERIAGDEKENQ